ncbi:MAG: universal stress protein [Deltaproteobacteria bacterium]|jgi:nucleotide-binding universal stress UspA family protein|nr:universal stress protein [Deltaproteobacteria bacterium]
MNVIAAINGQVTSEVAALYGLHFARIHEWPLTLLHVANPDDSIEAVEKSMENIEKAAAVYDLNCERVILEGSPADAVKNYLFKNRSEILFCSTRFRQRRKFFNLSFSEKLAGISLPVDLAEVRVVHVHSTLSTERIVMPIKEDRMSVEKFTFFASMGRAYNASGEIYSVTVTSKKKRAGLDLGDTRRILQKIDDRLSHYEQLAKLMDIPLRFKHAIALNEIDQVLHHLSHNDFHLMIVGGARLYNYGALAGKKPIERLQRCTPVNTIAFYLRGKTR